jgi:alpha-tubulin suppressor-like RCC1 family protein
VVIQKVARCYNARHHFRQTKKLAKFLQSMFRRFKAVQRLNWLRTSLMIEAEMRVHHAFRNREIIAVKKMVTSTAELRVGASYSRAGGARNHCLHKRILVGVDYLQDVNSVYPAGWLQPVLGFCRDLHANKKLDVEHIAVGGNFTVLVDDASNVYTFGQNTVGQLAKPKKRDDAVPVIADSVLHCIDQINATEQKLSMSLYSIQNIGSAKISKVVCGKEHCIVLTRSGYAISWGNNSRGQLGYGLRDFRASPVPRRVQLSKVADVCCGQFHSACLAGPGVLYTWGAAECLGRPSASTSDGRKDCGVPQQVTCFVNKRVGSLCCGDSFNVARQGVRVYTWGKDTSGQLGRVVTADEPADQPAIVRGIPIHSKEADDVFITTGGKHTLISTRQGLYAWGWNRYGQVGQGSTEDVKLPANITTNITDTRDAKIGILEELAKAQAASPAAAPEAGAPGESSFGSLFSEMSTNDAAAPPPPPAAAATTEEASSQETKEVPTFRCIVAGRRHTMVTLSSGELLVWGYVNHFNNLYGTGNQLLRRIKFNGVANARESVPSVVTLPSMVVLNAGMPGKYHLENFSSTCVSMSSIIFAPTDEAPAMEDAKKENLRASSSPLYRSQRRATAGSSPVRRASLSHSELQNATILRDTVVPRGVVKKYEDHRTSEDQKRNNRETALTEEFRRVRYQVDFDSQEKSKVANRKAQKIEAQKKVMREREGELTSKMIEDLFDPSFLSLERQFREKPQAAMPAWDVDPMAEATRNGGTSMESTGSMDKDDENPDQVSTQEMRDLQALVMTMNKESADREYITK